MDDTLNEASNNVDDAGISYSDEVKKFTVTSDNDSKKAACKVKVTFSASEDKEALTEEVTEASAGTTTEVGTEASTETSTGGTDRSR